MRVQVSIDTAVQHCEVWNLVARTSPTLWSRVRWALVVGMLVGIIHVRACVLARAGGRIHVRVRASHRHQCGVLVVAMVKPTWLGPASIYEGGSAEPLSWWGCAAIAAIIYLQCMVSQWASWKAGVLTWAPYCLHHHRGGRASFSWAGCPQVRVYRFRALTFVIVVAVN